MFALKRVFLNDIFLNRKLFYLTKCFMRHALMI